MKKKWYASKTNWLSLVMLVKAGVGLFAPGSGTAEWFGANSAALDGLVVTALVLFRNIFTSAPTEK